MADAKTIRAIREKLFNLLDSESEERRALFSLFTPEEETAFRYRWHTIPAMARVDPNKIPEPPFPDAEMPRLVRSANEKYIGLLLEALLEDSESSGAP
jgi:hypothetical protein